MILSSFLIYNNQLIPDSHYRCKVYLLALIQNYIAYLEKMLLRMFLEFEFVLFPLIHIVFDMILFVYFSVSRGQI